MDCSIEALRKLLDTATLVHDFFGGDKVKIRAWWDTPNPLLGNTSPTDMLLHDRAEKLHRFVADSIAEDSR